MDVELHLVARVRGHVDDSGVHADGVLGAHLHTIAAVDADPQVDVETDRILLDVGIGMLARDDGDALRRAHGLAEHAPHAARRPDFADSSATAAAESPGGRPYL